MTTPAQREAATAALLVARAKAGEPHARAIEAAVAKPYAEGVLEELSAGQLLPSGN